MNKQGIDKQIGTVHIRKRTYPLRQTRDGRVYYEVQNKAGNIERNYMFPELLPALVDNVHRV